MLKAIVGIEIEVTRVEGKFKLSQNRSAEDRTGVVLGLEADAIAQRQPEADALAQAMQARGTARPGGVRQDRAGSPDVGDVRLPAAPTPASPAR